MNQDVSSRGLRDRLLLILLVVAVISLACGWLVQREMMADSKRLVLEQQEMTLVSLASQVSRELGDVQRIVDILLNDSHIRAFITTGRGSGSEPENSLKELLLAWGSILQVRWLDDRGQERLRMDHGVDTDTPVMVPEGELQNKARRYYFMEGISAPEGHLYISRIDLNVERGAIITPYQPTLRAMVKTGESSGLRPGLLVVNYDLRDLFELLRRQESSETQIMVVDEDGYFLVHPERAYEWGRDFAKPDHTLAAQDPASWRDLQERNVLSGVESEQGILSSQKINVDAGGVRALYLISRYSSEKFAGFKKTAHFWGVLTALLIAIVGTAAALYDQRNLMLQNALNRKLQDEKRALRQTNKELDEHIISLKKMQDELVESRKLSALGMMVAGVAHELNTPVGGALIVTSGLEGDLRTLNRNIGQGLTRQALDDYTESAAVSLNLLNRNLKKAKDVVDSFKRLAVDRAGEELISFQLAQVIEDVVLSMQPLIKNSAISISRDITVHDDLVGYPGVLSQIVQNLLMNSINHAFFLQESKRVEIFAEQAEGKNVRLVFQDNGKGVEEEALPRLFDPFVTSSRGSGSSGLGLHLVHQWVTGVMHGSIKAENRETGGLRFVIQFPARIQV